jgi:hypothetical protein
MADNRNEIIFEIVEKVGVIAEYPTGWQKKINRVSWNDMEPKYDIRDWSPDHDHMSRGLTLHENEMQKLRKMLDARNKQKDKANEQKTPKAKKEKDLER